MDECNLWRGLMQRLRGACASFDGLWLKRRRVFDTESIVKGLLHLADGSRQSYHRLMDQIDLGVILPAPAASSFCEARAKLPPFVIGEVRREVLDFWDEHSPSAGLWHGYRPHAIDGTKVSLPRPLFEYGFKAPAGGHCPQALVSLLVRLSDRMICDIRLAKEENERREAHEHLTHLGPGDLVVYDRGYLSFGLLTAHSRLGIGAVFRVARGTSFLAVEKFWRGSSHEKIVTINPTSVTYRNAKRQHSEYELGEIRLRLIRYKIDGEAYVLATTILGEGIAAADFVTLYAERWRAEETFKALKQTLEMETFHSRSEAGIRQEIEAKALFWNLARSLALMAGPSIKKTSSLPKIIALSNQLSAEPREDSGRAHHAFFGWGRKVTASACRDFKIFCTHSAASPLRP